MRRDQSNGFGHWNVTAAESGRIIAVEAVGTMNDWDYTDYYDDFDPPYDEPAPNEDDDSDDEDSEAVDGCECSCHECDDCDGCDTSCDCSCHYCGDCCTNTEEPDDEDDDSDDEDSEAADGCECSCHECHDCDDCDTSCDCSCHYCGDCCTDTEESDDEDDDSDDQDSEVVILGPDGRPARETPRLNYHLDEADRIDRINSDIASVANSDFELNIRETQVIGAFFDGNTVSITTGLASILDDDEVAGVLAHEHAHGLLDTLGAKRGVVDQLMIVVTETWRDKDRGFIRKLLSTIFNVALGFLQMRSLSRRHELDADRLAARIARDAGYDPNGLVRALAKMHAPEDVSFLEEMISTHPPLRERRIVIGNT